MTEPITRRRRFLMTLGIVGINTIAGCSAGNDEEGTTLTQNPTASPTPTLSPSPTPTTPNEAAVEHYDAAIETLVQTKETLDEWAASSFEPSQVSSLQDQVATAREELDEAESNADPSGDLMARIEQARLVADIQELILAYYESVNVFFQLVSDGKSFGDNELHQRAADTFAKARGILEDARTVLDDMGTVLGRIDADVLGEPALEYGADPLDHLDLEDRRAIDGAESYTKGYENIHLAFVQLETGQKHYENEEFTDARTAWETGRSRARQSKSAFEAVIDNDYTPQNLREESIQLLGATETVIEAYDKFVDGAKAAEDGNIEKANNLVGEGFGILGEL